MRAVRRATMLATALLVVLGLVAIATRVTLVRSLPSDIEVASVVEDPVPLVVGVGDSVMSGYHCDGCSTFLEVYTERRYGPAGSSLNFGVPGLTTGGLDRLLRSEVGPIHDALTQADVVLVCIGANDVGANVGVDDPQQEAGLEADGDIDDQAVQISEGVRAVLERIDELLSDSDAQVFVLTYWNVYTDGEAAAERGPGYVAYSRAMTAAVNAAIADAASAFGAVVVDTRAAFTGPDGTDDDTALLATDGDHPNQAGHTLIASLIPLT